jgi:hypothetical protein
MDNFLTYIRYIHPYYPATVTSQPTVLVPFCRSKSHAFSDNFLAAQILKNHHKLPETHTKSP